MKYNSPLYSWKDNEIHFLIIMNIIQVPRNMRMSFLYLRLNEMDSHKARF